MPRSPVCGRRSIVSTTRWKRSSGIAAAALAVSSAGAQIVREPVTQDYGGRDYTCKDPEGHVWTFGTYDPMAG